MQNNTAGFIIPELLFPEPSVDLTKWSVVACDQFTSQPEYWREAERIVGDHPSCLKMILPEAYLNDPNAGARVASVYETMDAYLENGVFDRMEPGVMLILRRLESGVRAGVLLALDLETYDWDPEEKPLLRATEATVLSRIPARTRIRKDAPLELPHILILIDDPEDAVIGTFVQNKDQMQKMYDFDLMLGGGRVQGYFSPEGELTGALMNALFSLPLKDGMRACVGDGNHSLAAAKTVWNIAKKGLSEWERKTDPRRYALCEVINLHDPSLILHPIHRVLFGVDPKRTLLEVKKQLNEAGVLVHGDCYEKNIGSIGFAFGDERGEIWTHGPRGAYLLAILQPIFEEIAEKSGGVIDYIHGRDAAFEMSKKPDTIGFLLEPMEKSEFFAAIAKLKVLPKKTFSLGKAEEKRYYLEGRRL